MERNFIGSSDIGTILGLNPYNTILNLWAVKTGQVPEPDLSGNEAVEWGKRLERIVAKKFADEHNVKLIAYKKRFVHLQYPYITCELDNIIAGTDELVECKTCSLWSYKDWQNPDDIPSHYMAQVMWQLGITGRKVGWIAVLCGGQKYREKKIAYDDKVFQTMVQQAVKFWNEFVLPKVMPMTVSYKDSTLLNNMFPEVNFSEPILLGDEANRIAESLESMTQDYYSLKASIDKAKNELKLLLKDAECGVTSNYKITWRKVRKKEYTVPAQEYRELRYYNLKKDEQ